MVCGLWFFFFLPSLGTARAAFLRLTVAQAPPLAGGKAVLSQGCEVYHGEATGDIRRGPPGSTKPLRRLRWDAHYPDARGPFRSTCRRGVSISPQPLTRCPLSRESSFFFFVFFFLFVCFFFF